MVGHYSFPDIPFLIMLPPYYLLVMVISLPVCLSWVLLRGMILS